MEKKIMTVAEAVKITTDLAWQNVIDEKENPGEHAKQVEAINIVFDNFYNAE